MLIVFDVDGTLLGGEAHDWGAFDEALSHILGFVHPEGFFTALPDVTAETICEAVARHCGVKYDVELAERVRSRYLDNLRSVHTRESDAFSARFGAATLLSALRESGSFQVAIATGDWHPTISFKLQCAGLDLSAYPMATASDAKRRSEIIAVAAKRAGREVRDVVYVGDGVWDLVACRELGIPFIGTGSRLERLISQGAEHLCPSLDHAGFRTVLRRLSRPYKSL